jgi:hypothetical protein
MFNVLVAVVSAMQALTVTQPVPSQPVIIVDDPRADEPLHVRCD